MYSIKRFADITRLSTPMIKSAKEAIMTSLNKSTGIMNSSIAKNSLNSASRMSEATGDVMNSFRTKHKEGISVFRYARKKPVKKIKGPELPFEGGIPEIPKKKPNNYNKVRNSESGEVHKLANKVTFKKLFDNKRIRSIRTNQEGPEEIQKVLNTRGQSIIINNGRVIPGFGYE